MRNRGWKIGEIAKRTGLTVRALHHYDRIGLLKPSRVADSGHRAYTEDDIARLHRIMALKQLGFALEEIKDLLHRPGHRLTDVLDLQLDRLDEQIERLMELRQRLRDIAGLLHEGQPITADRLLMAIQTMRMIGSPHFAPEQSAELLRRFAERDAETERKAGEGRELIDEFRSCMNAGLPPDAPAVSDLAARWLATLAPADERFVESAERYYRDHPDEALQFGMDGELYAYIRQAAAFI